MTIQNEATDPNCTAPAHGNRKAYYRGCVCAAAVAAHEQRLAKERNRRAGYDRAAAVGAVEPDFVAVYLVAKGSLPFRALESIVDQAVAVVELMRTKAVAAVAAQIGLDARRVRELARLAMPHLSEADYARLNSFWLTDAKRAEIEAYLAGEA